MIDFDLIASEYGKYRTSNEIVSKKLIDTISKLNAPDAILELGCGTCNYAAKIQESFDTDVHGIDISEEMLSVGRGKNSRLRLINGDCNKKLIYSDNFFSLVYNVDFIHYIKDLYYFYAEQMRLLLEGGYSFTATHSKEDLERQTLGIYFPCTIELEKKRIYASDIIESAVKKNGFRNFEIIKVSEQFLLSNDDLNLYKHRTVSILNFIKNKDFFRGLERMESDIKNNKGLGIHSYTIFIGQK